MSMNTNTNMHRTILHCDLNGFFASVECLINPELALVPMAVAGNAESRHGIILAKNEKAKAFGIKTAETIFSAQKKCPELVLVPPRHGVYSKYSRIVNEIYGRFTDLVEPFGIDESWLDVTNVGHLFGDGKKIADTIRETVKKEVGLTISVGVSFNKVFAKLGSDYKKPDATTVITHENFKSMLYHLPVSALLFVGRSSQKELLDLRIQTIGQLASCDRMIISGRLGKMGEMIHNYANGLDQSPVLSFEHEEGIKSVGNGMTFSRDLVGIDDIRMAVYALSDMVAGRLRKCGMKCNTVSVAIKDTQFKNISRQKTLTAPTSLSQIIRTAAVELIEKSWSMKSPIRMLSVTGSNLVGVNESAEQITLFGDNSAGNIVKRENLDNKIDAIRKKYGYEAISTAALLNNDIGIGRNKKE